MYCVFHVCEDSFCVFLTRRLLPLPSQGREGRRGCARCSFFCFRRIVVGVAVDVVVSVDAMNRLTT